MNSLRPRNYAREIIHEYRYRGLTVYLICVAVAVCGGLYSLHVLS